MDLTIFYKECQQLPDNERQWVDAFYHNVCDVFGKDCKDFAVLSKACELFCGNSSTVSKAQYYRKRKLVRRLYDWLASQGAVSEDFVRKVYGLRLQDIVSEKDLVRYYFKDLDDVLRFVQLVGLKKGLSDFSDMLIIKGIVILTWYQLSSTELIELHKSDLVSETHSVLVDGREIQLKGNHFEILKNLAELDCHRAFPSRTQQIYVTSSHLMRSTKQAKLSLNNIQKTIQRFNTVAANYGKEISLTNLRRNGVFDMIYNAGDEKTTNTLMQEITGCDTAFAAGYKEFYEKWKMLIKEGV